jgi:NADPH:quinone reductase-like Zn-dependent oxidoreductase
MRAAWFETFGKAVEVLEVGTKPDPAPGAGEVLVRLRTSGVNPSDVKKRAGSFPNHKKIFDIRDLRHFVPIAHEDRATSRHPARR